MAATTDLTTSTEPIRHRRSCPRKNSKSSSRAPTSPLPCAQGASTREAPPAIEAAPQSTFGFEGEGMVEPTPIEVADPKGALDQQLGEMMGNAPCLNCGNSMGCS